jgi:hypothetical protein
MRSPTLSRLARIAEDQWGLVTRRQAQLAGVPPATLGRVTTGGDVLERVAQDTFQVMKVPGPGWCLREGRSSRRASKRRITMAAPPKSSPANRHPWRPPEIKAAH